MKNSQTKSKTMYMYIYKCNERIKKDNFSKTKRVL